MVESFIKQHTPIGYIDNIFLGPKKDIDVWFLLNKNNVLIFNSFIHSSSCSKDNDTLKIAFMAHHLYDDNLYRIVVRHSNVLLISLGNNFMDGVRYLCKISRRSRLIKFLLSSFFQFSKSSKALLMS